VSDRVKTSQVARAWAERVPVITDMVHAHAAAQRGLAREAKHTFEESVFRIGVYIGGFLRIGVRRTVLDGIQYIYFACQRPILVDGVVHRIHMLPAPPWQIRRLKEQRKTARTLSCDCHGLLPSNLNSSAVRIVSGQELLAY
jgi:hypothetical protein